MRLSRTIILCIIAVFDISSCGIIDRVDQKKDLSPTDFGLAWAKTGIERYEVLLKTHKAALAAGVNVDYSGLDTIRLEIPSKPSRIPLTQNNDFKGCVFVVKNTSKTCYLFGHRDEGTPISINKRLIDEGDFRSVDTLKRGRYLLIVEDENLWVQKRRGYNYGHPRKDILLVENGVAKNSVVMPYNNAFSRPKCRFVKLGKEPLVIKNIKVERESDCFFVTHVANIAGADDVRFENVSLHTPESPLNDDRGISIYNCTNVKMNNVRIEGTYSHTDHSGYGIFMNNVWNYTATSMYGSANWGVFGNNNINVAMIEDSQINRFDIHCYGRDISFKNVSFYDLYNQYSSVYGTILYDKCTFTDFVPVLNGGSYNSFVGHEVKMNDCVVYVTPTKNYLFKISRLNESTNARHELAEKCLPNVRINNLVVNMTRGAESFYVFNVTSSGKSISDIGYVKRISINGLTINSSGEKPVKRLLLSNLKIVTKAPVDCRMENVVVNQPFTEYLRGGGRLSVQLKANLSVVGGKIQLRNVTGIIE